MHRLPCCNTILLRPFQVYFLELSSNFTVYTQNVQYGPIGAAYTSLSHLLTEFHTRVQLPYFRTGSTPCTVLHSQIILVIGVDRSQITDHTIPAFSSCYCSGPIFNHSVVPSYSPSHNRPNYFDCALGILWFIHLIYPRGQEFTICTRPKGSMFVYQELPLTPLIHMHSSISAQLAFICSRSL